LNIYEMYGRQAEALEGLRLAYKALIELVRALKSGEKSLDDVQVDEGEA